MPAPSVHEFHDHTGVPKSRKLRSQEPRPTAGFTVADVIHPGETSKKINHFSATEKNSKGWFFHEKIRGMTFPKSGSYREGLFTKLFL